MEVMPGRAIDAPLFDCMAVSVSVADLGALATDDLSCFAVTREMVFEFIATKAGYKLSELFFFTLWRSYFGVTVPSTKIMAERTVYINRLDRHVGDRPATEIQNELVRSNPNINNIQVHKIKHYYHIIEVVSEDTETADAVIRDKLKY